MSYINENKVLNAFLQITKGSKVFTKKDKKTVILAEKIIDETISFNRNVSWDDKYKNIGLTTSAEELIQVFKLRSNVYSSMGYQSEFPDPINGLNYDVFDAHSAIVFSKINNEITGTTRVIFDSAIKLPLDKACSCDYMRGKYKNISELSRLIVKNESKGLSLDFKNLMRGIYTIFLNNPLDVAISVIKKDHYKLYSKFGGVFIEEEVGTYGTLDDDFVTISYHPSLANKFFERVILN